MNNERELEVTVREWRRKLEWKRQDGSVQQLEG